MRVSSLPDQICVTYEITHVTYGCNLSYMNTLCPIWDEACHIITTGCQFLHFRLKLRLIIIFIWDMTHSYETWLTHMRHDSCMWDVTPSYETWLIYVRHDLFIYDTTRLCETWLIRMRHDSFICDMTHSCVTWLIHMRHDSFMWVVYIYMCIYIYMCMQV